ncbi:hypothetical protein BKA62DRAFT_723325, partial [Auriculariales sp. MPI-PUGE-AT-0066]
MASVELAATYAALILADDGVEITADKITALTGAAAVEVEPIWQPSCKGAFGQERKDLLSNVGSGGGAPAAAGPVAGAGAGGAAPQKRRRRRRRGGQGGVRRRHGLRVFDY